MTLHALKPFGRKEPRSLVLLSRNVQPWSWRLIGSRQDIAHHHHPLIITESQSLCKGVDSAVDPLRRKLASCICTVGIQWVPGHCGIPGNELADQAANEARTISGPRRPSTYKALIPIINQHVSDPACRPRYEYIAETYSKMSRKRERTVECKKDTVYLA